MDQAERCRAWRERNVEHVREYSRQQWRERKEELSARKAKWRKDHPDEAREQDQRYAEKYRDKRRVSKHGWTASHLDHLREYNRRYREANRERAQAYSKVQRALEAGTLTKQPCEVCGDYAHAHHDNYALPLDVTWLCPLHHKQRHMKEEAQ